MIFSHYKETVLEQWISDQYRANQIQSPNDLDIESIAALFGVDLQYDNCKSFSDNQVGVIILDKREPFITSRMVFFHELCHVLRHVGDQRKMPELFKDAQEAEANAFLTYASMPFYMISRLQIPGRNNEVIQYLATTFQVPLKLAKQRIEHIQRREFQGILMSAAKQEQKQYTEWQSDCPDSSVETETQLFAYYDPTGEYDAPSQLIVCVDHQTLLNQEELIFSPDGPFERIESDHLRDYTGRPLVSDDIRYRDGQIVIKLRSIAERYRYVTQRFIIQFKDIESILDFEKSYF